MREQYAYITMPDMTITPVLQQFFDMLTERTGQSWSIGCPVPHSTTRYMWGCRIDGGDYILLHNMVMAGHILKYEIEAPLSWFDREYGHLMSEKTAEISPTM